MFPMILNFLELLNHQVIVYASDHAFTECLTGTRPILCLTPLHNYLLVLNTTPAATTIIITTTATTTTGA
jgi:hypothetical protein